jgi:hypothetical protein
MENREGNRAERRKRREKRKEGGEEKEAGTREHSSFTQIDAKNGMDGIFDPVS